MFLDENEFLDPSLFYRILEEAFDINLFIFSGTRPEANAVPIYNLDVSRYSSIPMHSFDPRRKTVILFKHWGSETDNLLYPQCECIVTSRDLIGVYDYPVGLYLLNGYYLSKSTTQFIPIDHHFEPFTPSNYVEVLSQGFLNSLMNKDSPIHAVSQIIDGKGKLRGLEMTSPKGSFVLAFPPMPPVDLRLTKKSNGHYELRRMTYENVIGLFSDKPTAKAVEKGYINGIWFPFQNLTFGVFVPIVLRKDDLDLPLGPNNPIEPITKSDTSERLLKIQRDLSFIIQITRWLYNLYRLTYPSIDPIDLADRFFDDYVVVEKGNEDSALDYDFTELDRAFPFDSSDVSEALLHYNEVAPSLSNGNNLILYGEKFAIKIKQSLIHYIEKNLEVILPQYLADYYFTEMDYPYREGNLVFLSTEAVDAWIRRYQSDYSGSFPVYTKLKPKMSEQELSYLYQSNQQIFLIRNVPISNGKLIALNIALNWKEKKINHYNLPLKNITSGYTLLTVSTEEGMAVVEDQGGDLMILNYPNSQKYAAVLPI